MMNFNDEWNRTVFAMFKMLIIGFLIGIVLACLCGCKSVEKVNVPEYHTKYIAQHDTLLQREYVQDSTIIYANGDTVFQERWKIRYKDREKVVYRDSVVRDSIKVPVVIKEKVKLGIMEKVFAVLALMLIFMLSGYILFNETKTKT